MMKVLCISGSRADYGAVKAIYDALLRREIDTQFFEIGNGTWVDPKPFDIAIVYGDRHEVIQATLEMYLEKKMIIHVAGGDITEGSQDDCMRHAITKLSHLHFPTNVESAKRIMQMGEEPWRVKVAGYPGIDNINGIERPSWVPEKFILAVWHPNTMVSKEEALVEATIFANALEKSRGEFKVIIIGPNDDVGGAEIAEFFDEWADFTGNIFTYGETRPKYLWLMRNAQCLVGNSSSGIYEAPSFGTPVLNIGDRQKGRTKAPNVHDCPLNEVAIEQGIRHLIYNENKEEDMVNPFYKGNAADRIAEVISNIEDPKKLLVKKFHEF